MIIWIYNDAMKVEKTVDHVLNILQYSTGDIEITTKNEIVTVKKHDYLFYSIYDYNDAED